MCQKERYETVDTVFFLQKLKKHLAFLFLVCYNV